MHFNTSWLHLNFYKLIRFISLFLLLLTTSVVYPQQVGGVVTDEKGNPLPAVNIFIKNTTTGSTSGTDGRFRFEVKQGTQTVVFRILGYETIEQDVDVTGTKPVELNVSLKEKSVLLNEAVIFADRRDIAREVMGNAREKRRFYLDALKSYTCLAYRKVSLMKEYVPEYMEDTTQIDTNPETEFVLVETDYVQHTKTTSLREYFSRLYADGTNFREEILAENEYRAQRPFSSVSITMGVESKGMNISNLGRIWQDPYMLLNDAASLRFNFLMPSISAPVVSAQPLLSPLAPAASISYVYDFDGIFYEENIKIYKIRVTPVFPGDALFEGHMLIEDSTWALRGVDLIVNPRALLYCKEFRIRQSYIHLENAVIVPEHTEIEYRIRDGKDIISGNISMNYSEYDVNIEFPGRTFTNEVITYDQHAFNRDSIWWSEIRPLELTENERSFALKIDSLQKVYQTQSYIDSLDSAYNDINIWSFLIRGVGLRSSIKQREIYFVPLIAQMNPFGIGGYRHRFGGYYNKRFRNDVFLETEGLLDYGFNNRDVRGKAGVGITYIPQKFVRTFIRFGDYYDMINDYASIASVFSRSNYVRTQTLSVAQRMEILNGLFGELTVTYSDQTPIKDMKIESWSNQLFGELNEPADFERYKKLDVRLEFKIRPAQKYIMKGKRKIILETNMPEFSIIYRKGIPRLFGSEVNYDFLEIGVHDDTKLARWGTSNWAVLAGTFLNRKNLRLIEHRYFRGSDMYFFSDPLQSFQLLDATLSSSTTYFRTNYMHHFDGAILNKVPLFNRLKISLAAGAGILMMEENNFRHAEFFVGLERIIRIRKQLFRIGVFGVTADNNLSKARITYKVGINFYNPFTRKWDY